MKHRTASVERITKETKVNLEMDLDGVGESNITTGNGMLDHLISQLSRHGLVDISIVAKGDIEVGWHHLVEDTAICLGKAFNEAVGEGRGINRMGHALVPLDESLAMVAVDISGRGYANIDISLNAQMVETLPGEMVHHFLETFATEGKFNLHAKIMSGTNGHHKAESTFKALAKALRHALNIQVGVMNEIPSTKGTISE